MSSRNEEKEAERGGEWGTAGNVACRAALNAESTLYKFLFARQLGCACCLIPSTLPCFDTFPLPRQRVPQCGA